ncbi:MAG: D-alanyl-D-alanine carboxypeptidase [Clostridia bacterium]|nr:D-alanyl-D-alanine carboxypeptidase [Clostridia bacterium]
MNLKKIYKITIIFIFLASTIVYANNIDEEQIDLTQIKQELAEVSSNASNIPDINSRSAIVLERTTKSVLYGKNEYDVRKMASTTKIMTAIVVIENADLYSTVTISKKAAATGGSTLGISEGDKITVCDLLYGLLLKSGNDTAVALAEHVGGSIEGFADMMNEKAKSLNLVNTHFVTPHGLDNDNHYTTAYELALLTNYALQNQTFANFVETKNHTVTINGNPKSISNTNELLGNLNGVYGVKTGFTNGANRCLVTACKRDNLDIICVVLGADTKKFRTQDSIKLIEYAFKKYQMFDIEKIVNENFSKWKKENISKFKINKGITNNIDLEIPNINYKQYPIPKESINNISTLINCKYTFDAPLVENTTIGNLQVIINKDTVLNFDIVNKIGIEKKNCFNYLKDFLAKFFKYLTINF